MGESACLLRSFSHPSDASREAKEGDPIRALGESISFGRFMSESLAWEKFSAFSHNRYQEELEKFSKPGSVAQKKAYFEAHYKRKAAQKAAAVLEEANTTEAMSRVETEDNSCINSCLDLEPLRPNNQLLPRLVLEEPNTTAAMIPVETEDNSCINSCLDSEPLRPNDQLLPRLVLEEPNNTAAMSQVETEDKSCINTCVDSEPLRPNDQVIETSEQENFVQNAEFVSPMDDADAHDPKNEESMMETDKVEEEVLEQNYSMETAPNVENTNQNENVEDHSIIVVAGDEKTPASPAAEKEVRSSGGSLKRIRNYSTKLLTRSWSSKSKSQSSPAKQAANSSQQSMNKGNATPKSKKHVGNVVEKLTMKSIHMSMHFSPSLKEIGTTSPDLPQIGRKRIHMSSVVAPKETSTAPQKITNRVTASVNGFLKQPLIKPPLDNKRCLKSSNASGTERKERPPLICSPFSFRSEERVAKRREFFQKLEEKANSKEMGQKQLRARCQETKKNDVTKLRQSRIFEAKANQDSSQGSKSATEHIKMIPATRPQSPKLGRKSASSRMVRNISSLPPKRPSVNSDDAKSVVGKRYGGIAQSVTSLGKKMNGCENFSPNIPS